MGPCLHYFGVQNIIDATDPLKEAAARWIEMMETLDQLAEVAMPPWVMEATECKSPREAET